MRTRRHTKYRAALAAATLAGLLAGPPLAGAADQGHILPATNAAPALAARPPAAPASFAPQPADGPEAAGFHMAPLDTYAEVLRRPLFSPDRRPHEVAPAAAALPQSFALRGIVVEGGTHYALVAEGSTTKRVTEGQTLGGGTVTKIMRDRLVLNVNGVDTAVKLFDPNATGKPTPGLSTAGGIPSQMPPGFPPVSPARPALSGG